MTDIQEGLVEELKRARELKKLYEDIPDGCGRIAVVLISKDIERAEAALSSGDAVEMVKSYSILKELK